MIDEKSKINTYGRIAEGESAVIVRQLDNTITAAQKQRDRPPELFLGNDSPTVKLNDRKMSK